MKLINLVVAVALTSTGSAYSEVPVSPKAFKKILAGSWDEGKLQKLCGPERNQFTIVFSKDGSRVIFTFDHPQKIYENQTVSALSYRVIGTTSVSLILALEGGTRKNAKGDLFVWELVVVDHNLFHWRSPDFAPGVYNDVWGRRCK